MVITNDPAKFLAFYLRVELYLRQETRHCILSFNPDSSCVISFHIYVFHVVFLAYRSNAVRVRLSHVKP